MTTYGIAFEESQYLSVASRAAKYQQDNLEADFLPLISDVKFDSYEYRWTKLEDPFASYAGSDWSPHGRKGQTQFQHTDYDLFTQQMNLYFGINEYNKFGEQLIADMRGAIVDKWAEDVNDAIMHGPVNQNGIKLAQGIIGQITGIENLDGTDSVLDVKGDIWYGINTMIDAIPFAIRKEGPDMIMITDEQTRKEAFSPDRIYQDMVEGDFIYRHLLGETAIHTRKISKWIVSNKILAQAGDTTKDHAAGAKTTADTLATDSRIFLFVPDARWIGRVVSRGYSLVGEDQGLFGTEQVYGWKGRGIVFNTDCCEYSEEINW